MTTVFIVGVDYGCEGVSNDPKHFRVFATRCEAEDFIRHVNEFGTYGQLIVIEAEWMGNGENQETVSREIAP